jgi:hypothetical protein
MGSDAVVIVTLTDPDRVRFGGDQALYLRIKRMP